MGDCRLHLGAQLLHKLGIVSMGSGVGEDGRRGGEDPRDTDGIPSRLRRRRTHRHRGIDVGGQDGDRIVTVAADLEGPQLLGKIPQRRRFDLPETPLRMVVQIRSVIRLRGNRVHMAMARDPEDEIRIGVERGKQLVFRRLVVSTSPESLTDRQWALRARIPDTVYLVF